MKNKSILVFYALCALVPIIFIAVAFFGPEKEIAISLKGPNTFGLDDEKITKKYDQLEDKEKKKREKFKKEVEKNGIPIRNQHRRPMYHTVRISIHGQ